MERIVQDNLNTIYFPPFVYCQTDNMIYMPKADKTAAINP